MSCCVLMNRTPDRSAGLKISTAIVVLALAGGCAGVPSGGGAAGGPGRGGAGGQAPGGIPTSAEAGGQTIIAISPPPVPAVQPPNLIDFLGIPQIVQGIGGFAQKTIAELQQLFPKLATLNPELEATPPVLSLNDPSNLESDNPAIKAAAEVKLEEDAKPQKIKAIRYLGTLGCRGCYPKVEEALLAALDDCTEDVRYEAVRQMSGTAGSACHYCKSSSCCSKKVRERLEYLVSGRDETGCLVEPSARVRRTARIVLDRCGVPRNPPISEEGPVDDLFADASEAGKDVAGPELEALNDPLAVPEGESISLSIDRRPSGSSSSRKSQANRQVASVSTSTDSRQLAGLAAGARRPFDRHAASPAKPRHVTGRTASNSTPGLKDPVVARSGGVEVYRSELEKLARDWVSQSDQSESQGHRMEQLRSQIYEEVERLIAEKQKIASASNDSKIVLASATDETDRGQSGVERADAQTPQPPKPGLTATVDPKFSGSATTVFPDGNEIIVPNSCPVCIAGSDHPGCDGSAVIKITEEALRAFYEQHRERYLERSEVRWETVSAGFRKFDSRQQARDVMEALREKIVGSDQEQLLQTGAVLSREDQQKQAELEKLINADRLKTERYGWTQTLGLPNSDLRAALTFMPVGNISPIIEVRDSWQLVRVLEARKHRIAEFEEVREKVRHDYLRVEMARLDAERRRAELKKHRNWTVFEVDEYIMPEYLENLLQGATDTKPKSGEWTVFEDDELTQMSDVISTETEFELPGQLEWQSPIVSGAEKTGSSVSGPSVGSQRVAEPASSVDSSPSQAQEDAIDAALSTILDHRVDQHPPQNKTTAIPRVNSARFESHGVGKPALTRHPSLYESRSNESITVPLESNTSAPFATVQRR